MPRNPFKAIRKSYFTGTLLTSVLSNIMVFGQPIQQMSQSIRQLEVLEHSRVSYFTDNVGSLESVSEEVAASPPIKHEGTSTKEPSTVFRAFEEQGCIGVSSEVAKENPRDNFFTVELPETLDMETYNAVLDRKSVV